MEEEQIIYKKVSELKNNPKNPRKNDGAVDSVAKSIEKYGFRNPLIIDKDNVVWCGNTRLKASRKLKLSKVPCIVIEDLTGQQMTELSILDNKTNEIAEWDINMLDGLLPNLDFSDFDIDFGLSNAEESDYGTDFSLPDGDKGNIQQMTFTLANEQAELIKYAISITKDEVVETFGNSNSNGNAIYEVVRQWAEQKK